MALNKNIHYKVYDSGISDGKEMVSDFFGKDDLLDVALEPLPSDIQKRIEGASLPDLEKAVSNYVDGLEDGVKLQLKIVLSDYIRWLRKAYK